MKHSWGWKHHRELEGSQAGLKPSGSEPPSYTIGEDSNSSEASDKLVAAVKTGIRSVMDTMVGIEKAFQEERAEMDRRRAQQMATRSEPVSEQPVSPRVHVPITETSPSMTRPADVKPPVLQTDPTLSQILKALEKINTKLDSQPPVTKTDGPGPRLV